jgi:NAD(P)-dependent dehydrogenase (short-subunit alcohol dehydrogenase family)
VKIHDSWLLVSAATWNWMIAHNGESGVGTVAVTAVNSAREGWNRSLAVELAPVRVNAVSPRVVDTEGWSHSGEDRQATLVSAGAALPVGRVGRPADVASAVVPLIDNGFTTGTVHHVDGGARLV